LPVLFLFQTWSSFPIAEIRIRGKHAADRSRCRHDSTILQAADHGAASLAREAAPKPKQDARRRRS